MAVASAERAELHKLMESDHSLGYAVMKRLALLLTSELISFAAG